MTAPDGAFQIGDSFGQDVEENVVKSLFAIPTPTFGTARDTLRATLQKIPQGSLKTWQNYIGGTDEDFVSVDSALDFIIGTTQDKPASNLGDVIDSLVQGIRGWFETGWNVAALKEAAQIMAESISDMAAIVTRLQQRQADGLFSGVASHNNFTTLASGSSIPGFIQGYSGSGSGVFGIDGGYAAFTGSASNRLGWALHPTPTETAYQKIGAVFASAPSKGLLGGSRSANWIVGRSSVDFSDLVYLLLYANEWELGCYVGGSKTVFDSSSSFKFKPGAIYWLECGTTGGLRIFRIWENDKVLKTYTDSGAVSGATDTYAGLAVTAFSDNFKPGKVAALSFFDNTPAPVLGSGWRVMRTNTGSSNQDSGNNTFPSSWFDTVDYISPDLSYDAVTGKVTVEASGWYVITVSQYSDSSIAVGGGACGPTLRVNGSTVQRAGRMAQTTGSGSRGFAGTFVAYLQEGDEVQPGYWSSWTGLNLLQGEASGAMTFFSGVFVGNNRKPQLI